MNSNSYYLVPVTATGVKFRDKGLRDVFKTVEPELYEKEVKRLELKYGDEASKLDSKMLDTLIERANLETKALFKLKKIPEKIVVVKNGDLLYELATEFPITVEEDCFIAAFRTEPNNVVEFFMEDDSYPDDIANFFSNYDCKTGVHSK